MKLQIHLMMSLSLTVFLSFIPPSKKFIDPANMDLSVKPGNNFFLYANGGWIKRNPVPPSLTRWGSFDELREKNSDRLKDMLEQAAAKKDADSNMRKVGDFYASGMDSIHIEQLGVKPIQADLSRIAAIKDINGVLDEVAFQHKSGLTSPLFGFSIDQDRKEASKYIPQFEQGGVTLPDRDYYIRSNSRMIAVREAYMKHLVNMFRLIGDPENIAEEHAKAVMNIETALAKAQNSRVEMRDPYKTYNKFSIADLNATTPSIDWSQVLKMHGIEQADSVIVNNPGFLKADDMLLTLIPVENWKTYLSWQVLHNVAPYLSTAFVKEDFSFVKILTGQKKPTPRWQRMSNLIDRQLGDIIGKMYVEKYFRPESKQRMLDLVNNLQQTFASRIKKLDWMSDATKHRALEKLNSFTKKIAYTDKWKNYSTVRINRNDLIGNIKSSGRWGYAYMVERYGKPVDKTRWSMTPPTINAYYNPTNNEIVFPAGILQFPFYDYGADDAVNYGGIGAVIGHEMTHGFDDNGRQYGPDGNLHDWWTNEDAEKFKARAGMVVNQYNAMTVQDSIHVNGKLTLGENLADLGGLSIAYEAFTHTRQFQEGKKIDGFTPAQRFFLNWAQVWRTNILPETEAQLILVDPHSPGMHRANGPITNIDAWYEAFNVKQGDSMYKPADKRVHVW